MCGRAEPCRGTAVKAAGASRAAAPCATCSSAAMGGNPTGNRSCLKPGRSAKPSVFQGLLCRGFDQIPPVTEQSEAAHRASGQGRGRTEPRSALAGYFPVLGSSGCAEIAAVAICPCVILACPRITGRCYGLPNFWTASKVCSGGVGRAAAARLPPQHSLAASSIFLSHSSAKRLVSA